MMQGEAAALFTDPPYNVRIPGHAQGRGWIKHPDEMAAARLGSAAAAGDGSPHDAGFGHTPRAVPADRDPRAMGKWRGSSQSTGYKVGYGRPPESTRFQPGRSGNPKGRPRQQKTTGALLQQALSRRVKIQQNGRTKSLSTEEVALRQLINKAAKGDLRATKMLFDLKDRHQESSREGPIVVYVNEQDAKL
jgi:hypothetical protein